MTAWWHDLSQRERLLIMAAGAVLGLAILIFLVINPLVSYRNDAWADYTRATETYRRVVLAAASASDDGATDPAALRSVVTSTANRSGIVINRVSSEAGVLDVSIGNTQAGRLYGWLTALEEQHQVVVSNAQIRSSGSNGVTARLTFAVGS